MKTFCNGEHWINTPFRIFSPLAKITLKTFPKEEGDVLILERMRLPREVLFKNMLKELMTRHPVRFRCLFARLKSYQQPFSLSGEAELPKQSVRFPWQKTSAWMRLSFVPFEFSRIVLSKLPFPRFLFGEIKAWEKNNSSSQENLERPHQGS